MPNMKNNQQIEQSTEYPELMDLLYTNELNHIVDNPNLVAFIDAKWDAPRAVIERLIDSGDVVEMEDAITDWQNRAEAVGFLLGFRCAMRLAREVFR